MKRYILTILIAIVATFSAKAMDYEEARQRAWFLTDKMAYELNLTPEQCDRAYQINLDYLMNVHTASDCSGYYWQYRDTDFRCILFDWQYNLYRTLDYFFRPVRWVQSSWYYPVFNRYRFGYYYFDRPAVYVSYRGGMWRRRGHSDPSPYIGLRPHRGSGMRDHYQNRPWFGSGHSPNRPPFGGDKRPGGNQGFTFDNGRPNGNRPSNGGDKNNNRPDNGRPNAPRPSNGTRPNNGGSNGQFTFRDPYTNYRQTGNSLPNIVRGGARGVGQTSGSQTSGSRSNVLPAVQRSSQPTQNRNNATSNRGSGRSFGGR